MAQWLIEREPDRGTNKITIWYLNLQSKKKFNLGQLSSDVPDSMILDWILNFGLPAIDDLIVLSDGNRLTFTSHGLRLEEIRLDDGTIIALDRRASA